MLRSIWSRIRPRSPAPPLVLGCLASALALTAAAATPARAGTAAAVPGTRLVPDRGGVGLRILDWTLWNISKYYVDPSRLDPQAMTLAGLEAIEASVPAVLVVPSKDGSSARVRVGTTEREFPVEPDLALWAVGPRLASVLRFVEAHTSLDDKRRREVEYNIVAEVLSTLDPHTNLLRPEVFEDMKTSTQGSFGGLGIEIGSRDGFLTVIRVIDGNPASEVDMRPGDRIVQIDAESTVTMPLTDAVKLLRGPPGTRVEVYVMREGLAKPKRLQITRATIKLDSVVGDVVQRPAPDGKDHPVGVIQISRNFAQTTPRELRAKLDEFRKAQVEGVVLDLRGNPGGLLTSAVEVADAFLSSGMIVATVGSDPSKRDENDADDQYDFDPVPVVVLVNQGSASASEIVAGALHNQGRAVLLGRRTFGKGSVQVLHERRYRDDELALKLTIAQYLIPGDESIQSIGVTPDLETIPVYVGPKSIEYFGRRRFDRLRESSLSKHFEGQRAKPQAAPFGPLYFLGQGSIRAKADAAKSPRTKSKNKNKRRDDKARAKLLLDDPEIRIAADLTLWAPMSQRDAIMSRLPEFIQDQTSREQAKIASSLARRGVDWSPPPPGAPSTPPRLHTEVAMDRPENVIPAGQKATVTMTVTNLSDTPAYQVRAITDSDDPYFDEIELFFGKIDPGQRQTYAVELAVAEHELSRADVIDVQVTSPLGADLDATSQTSIEVRARALPRPQFAFGYQILDDPRAGQDIQGNGDGRLQVGERVRVRVDLRNAGQGPALDTWVTLRNLSGEAVFLHTGRAHLEELAPAAQAQASLDLEVREQPRDGATKVRLIVSDNKLAEVLSETFEIPVSEDPAAAEPSSDVVQLAAGTPLYASADLARPVARVSAASTFRTTARFQGAARLRLAKGRVAFARASDLEPASGRPRPKFEPVFAISPPTITLTQQPTRTEAASLRLRGTVTDEQAVRDVYITVSDPLRDWMKGREKVFYTAAEDPTTGQLAFDAEIPLQPGNNLIEIFAREDDDIVGTYRMWVLRTGARQR